MDKAAGAGDLERPALARSDRYLQEFVEALDLCPFARRCREEGRLVRRVILDDYVLAAALRAIAEIEALPEKQCEVALLIMPRFADGAAALQEVCGQTRRHLRAFHCVAFHPDLKTDFSNENRAVPFFRRAPDPMLQLVRVSTLERGRAGRPGGGRWTRWIDLPESGQRACRARAAPQPVGGDRAREPAHGPGAR